MEDGDINSTEVPATIKADETKELMNTMANYPDVEVTVIKNKNNTDCKRSENCTKINGESEKNNSDEQEEYTSDEDALIIDEECKKVEIKSNTIHKRIRSPSPRANFKGFKKRIIAKSIHFLKITKEIRNTYCLDDNEIRSVEEKVNFTEDTQGELNATISKESVSQNRNDSDTKTGIKDIRTPKSVGESNIRTDSPKNKNVTIPSLKSSAKKTVKKRPSQKLTEYAQYLGLQPAVKFKCVKCSESSFPSLSALNEHQRQCLVQPPTSKPAPAPCPAVATPSSTNFRVTRKVFLCSSCGTYYENCNLFLHMREVHRRYICLYCLGMFSLPEKLSHHLVTKHNCSPDHYSSADDFLSSYRESCFLVCCHCETVFSERDNFFHHVCVEKRETVSEKTCWSCGIKGSGTHPATCKANTEQPPSTSTQTPKPSSKTHQKSTKNKSSKSSAKAPIAPVEHVTADSPSTSLMSAEVEPETNLAEHFMADVSSSCLKTEPESPEKNMSVRSSSPSPVENKDVNENNFELVTNETDKNPTTEMASDVDKPVEDREDELNEVHENKNENEEDDKMSTTKSDIVEERKSDHDDDNDEKNDNILPEDSSDSINDTVSRTDNNNSDVENMQCDNNLESKNVDGNETNDVQSTSENKESSQISSDLELSNNEADEEDEQTENCENSNENDNQDEPNSKVEVEETRKVPKVTLKLPPQGLIYSENESDDSEKLTMEVDENCESDNDCEESQDTSKTKDESDKPVNGIDEHEKDSDHQSDDELYQLAGEDVPVVELELEQPLDKFEMENLLKICLGATIPMCVYCNHARKIAVNGKQLGLHAIAEHRFAATVNSITAEELIPKNFVTRIKESLDEVESLFFCLAEKEKPEEEIKEDGSTISSFKRIYECFQCRYVTTIHKELYLHNRKMHAKTILLCIMCKSNFYSYSELICHLCPGEYVLNSETKFRCCMCETNDLPSAFRLMVHLRKRHHTCDVCLEGCHNQSKLSNHVWKHKLHHLCYRCGIAYRNKPDITKHLFWKHGTESVLCKKCLQKKWPHVYHFCIPPVSFVCEECNLSFSKAVYLKVHKRLHINEKPHACTEEGCTETFISKKLLLKHEMKHREPVPIENLMEIDDNKENIKSEKENDQDTENSLNKDANSETVKQENGEKDPNSPAKEEVKPKSIIDVYDLPALNLSESDSDSEEEKPKSPVDVKPVEETKLLDLPLPDITAVENETPLDSLDEEQKPVPILDGIWDNFKNYQATLEKKDILSSDLIKDETQDEKLEDEKIEEEVTIDINVIMADHDYCAISTTDTLEMEIHESEPVKNDESTGLDHDYCTVSTNKNTNQGKTATPTEPRTSTPDMVDKKKGKTQKKKASKHNGSSSSSDSSSDSDSSSCTCGSNCSCSSSSGSSSSSSSTSDSDTSSSEGKRRIQARRERRKERAKRKKESETSHAASNTSAVDVIATEDNVVPVPLIELPILESDLDTDETETDEDFYDEHPQRLANKILAEKRNQLALLAAVAPVSNGTILECSRPSTPSIPEETTVPKKKVKSKKRKKKSRSSTPKQEIIQPHIPDYHNHHTPLIIKPILPVTPINTPMIPSPLSIVHPLPTPRIHPEKTKIRLSLSTGSGSETDANVRSSKRRRVPNKFYGYSSDEEGNEKPPTAPVIKWRKSDLPAAQPQLVPPITIKNIPSPAPVIEPVRAPVIHHSELPESDSDTEEVQHRKSTSDSSESNRNDDSDSDTGQLHISQPPMLLPSYPSVSHHLHPSGAVQRTNENLYCYCQCPYDEVSEMIACDGKECAIEWFHFECVGIMVPPKGKWFCPDCRKKSSSRSEFLQT